MRTFQTYATELEFQDVLLHQSFVAGQDGQGFGQSAMETVAHGTRVTRYGAVNSEGGRIAPDQRDDRWYDVSGFPFPQAIDSWLASLLCYFPNVN